MPRVTVRYWAAARAAAGVAESTAEASTLGELLAAVRAAHGERLSAVLKRCSYVVDEQPAGRRDRDRVPLRDGAVVEVLPPFAGGAVGGPGAGT